MINLKYGTFYTMIDKEDVRCLTILKEGHFYTEILVYFDTEIKKIKKFNLRVMNKKSIVDNPLDEDIVMNELEIRSKLRHPFLINQVAAFQDYDNLFYMTEYAPIKLLNNNLISKPLKISTIQFYAAEIICCLNYLHSKNQIYTFLTPELIFLGEDGHIKLNYAFCNCMNDNDENTNSNVEYSSLESAAEGGAYSKRTDYWSLGIILYLMAMGYTPFGGESEDETIYSLKSNDFEFPDFFDSNLKDLILKFLQKKNRLGEKEGDIFIIKKHPFFQSIDWNALERKELIPPLQPIVESPNIENAPSLSKLYPMNMKLDNKDGFGETFSKYNTINFLID